MKQKNKKIKWEKIIANTLNSIGVRYPVNRTIKDIENNNKHRPKGKR